MNHVEHLELLLYINYTSIKKYNHTEGVRASTYGFWGLQLSAWLGSPEMCICYPPIGLGFLSLSSLRATPNSWSCHISSMDRLCLCLAAKLLQSCPTLCGPRDGSPPGSPDPGILQARTPEWVAISFSNAWKWKVKVKSLSRVRLLATPWTAAYQAPSSMGFSRQESWSGIPLPSPIKQMSQ